RAQAREAPMIRPAARVGVMAVLVLWAGAGQGQDATGFDGWITDRANGGRPLLAGLRDSAPLSWRGACVGGRAPGAGTLAVAVAGAPDRTYAVSFRRGRIEGTGTIEWDNGDRYAGEFRDGRRTGRGTLTWAGGGSYDGDFVDGQITGSGVQLLPNGA